MAKRINTFTGETINTLGYTKADGSQNGSNITGKALRVETSPYAVIDFDIYDQDMKDDLKKQIVEYFKNKTKIVQTYSGGFHIYCKDDGTWSDLDKNRITKLYRSEELYLKAKGVLENSYEIDIFLSHLPTKRNLIVLPGSKVKTEKSNNEIREYILLSDCKDEKLITFTEVLKILSDQMAISITKPPTKKKVSVITKENKKPVSEAKLTKLENHSYISKELFDAIVRGFDETIVVHGDSGCSIDDKLGCFHIISALYACINEKISKSDVSTSLDLIKSKVQFSNNDAESRWETEHLRVLQNENETKWTNLLKILRIYNPDYFSTKIKPLIAPKRQFEEGNYTFENYQNQAHTFRSIWEHLNALAKCIAKNNKDGGFIKKTYSGKNIIYETVSTSRISGEFKSMYRLPTSEEEKAKMREQKKAVREYKEYYIIDLIREAEMRGLLKRFNGMSLQRLPGVLWSYRPPRETNYNKELIEKWIEFMKSRVVYESPLMEELYTHAYRFRNVGEFPVKFFVHYEALGNAGKSFLAGCLGLIYPDLSNVALKPAHMTDKHCSSFTTKLMVHLEEPEDAEQARSKGFQQHLKQITTQTQSVRPLYQSEKEIPTTSISGMNSNDPSLYGLIRADAATKSRMVIVQFKPADRNFAEMNKICKSFTNHPEFAYSLYKYLKDDIVIPESYTTERYDGPEKDEILANLTAIDKSSVNRWLQSMTKKFGDYNQFLIRKVKGVEMVYRELSWFNDGCPYVSYCTRNKVPGMFKPENLIKEMKTLGFKETPAKFALTECDGTYKLNAQGKKQYKSVKILTMPKDDFMRFDPDIVQDEEEDEEAIVFDD